MTPLPPPIRIFFSYAHKDEALRIQLHNQLTPWEMAGDIECWSDRQIPPGENWSNEIAAKLNDADIVLLLVSPDFFGSRFCMREELPRVIKRYEEEKITVIPILLRPCSWVESRYNIWQGYPKDLVPVTHWTNQDAAFYDVAQGILAAVRQCASARATISEQPHASDSPSEEAIEAKYLANYLAGQKLDCHTIKTDGIRARMGFVPLLEEVYVPLAISATAFPAGFCVPETESDLINAFRMREEGLGIWQFLAKAGEENAFKRLAILAWGGYGKTTLLKHIAYIYATRQASRYDAPEQIPVLLILRKYRDRLTQNPPSLPDLIATDHASDLPGDVQISSPWAASKLKNGEMVVMLDGFDEVEPSQRPAVSRWIEQQMRKYPRSIFIVTSRPKAYQEQEGRDQLELNTILWVKEFTPRQRKDLVERWYVCQERYANGGRNTPDVIRDAQVGASALLQQIENRKELRDLARNPLLLNMMMQFHQLEPTTELPKRRVELYAGICRLQLRDKPQARQLALQLVQSEAQTILQMLALEMMQKHLERWDRDELLLQLAKYLRQQAETMTAVDFLEQVEQISELLVKRDEAYEFATLRLDLLQQLAPPVISFLHLGLRLILLTKLAIRLRTQVQRRPQCQKRRMPLADAVIFQSIIGAIEFPGSPSGFRAGDHAVF